MSYLRVSYLTVAPPTLLYWLLISLHALGGGRFPSYHPSHDYLLPTMVWILHWASAGHRSRAGGILALA